MGDEGFKAGLYIVRASEPGPRFDIPRFHFMVGAKAVVQDNGDNDWHSRGSLDLSKIQELRDLGRSKSCTSHWASRITESTHLIERGHQSKRSVQGYA